MTVVAGKAQARFKNWDMDCDADLRNFAYICAMKKSNQNDGTCFDLISLSGRKM